MRTKLPLTPKKNAPALKRTGRSKLFNTTGLLMLLLAIFTWQCKKDTFIPTKGLCPIVVSTDPANGDTNVVINKQITATFNEVMDPATINTSTFLLNQGTNVISGTVTYSGSTATFSPASVLASNTVYTGTITNSVKDPSNNTMIANYVWSFRTGMLKDTVRPLVVTTDPANLATNVVLNKVVTATFSETMDPLTITATTFMLKQGITTIVGAITYSGTTASFKPTSLLAPSTLYTGTITTGAKDAAGNSLAANYTWTFTTGLAADTIRPLVVTTDPANLATNVIVSKTVTATFSEAMNPSTINSTNFTLTKAGIPVAGVVTYSGMTASYDPTLDLLPNTVYTGKISTLATDMANNGLLADYIWTFTTAAVIGDTTRPTVISTDPMNLSTNVASNKIITATFSELMKGSTITPLSFLLKHGVTNDAALSVTYSGTTASFTPSVPLLPSTTYTATIKNTVEDLATNTMLNDYIWTFTTASVGDTIRPTVISTDPVNLATLVPLNKIIKATFSELMDTSTINVTSFLLKHGTTNDTGVVTKTGTVGTYTPKNNLLPNTTYTATIKNTVKDLAGNNMLVDYVWTFTTVAASFTPWVDLGTAGDFGILAGTAITNAAGLSKINDMDVGIYPGARSSITGFPPAVVVNGAIFASDDVAPPGVAAMLLAAKTALTAAYLQAEGATAPAPVTVSGDQGGKTLAPGIYKSTSTLLIQAGDLTLDGGGDPNAQWIFQIASGFTTIGGAGGSIVLSGGAQAKNIYWQTGSSATIGDYTTFYGNILALTTITMNSHAVATGRMLARNGAVTMTSTNIINKP